MEEVIYILKGYFASFISECILILLLLRRHDSIIFCQCFPDPVIWVGSLTIRSVWWGSGTGLWGPPLVDELEAVSGMCLKLWFAFCCVICGTAVCVHTAFTRERQLSDWGYVAPRKGLIFCAQTWAQTRISSLSSSRPWLVTIPTRIFVSFSVKGGCCWPPRWLWY